MTFHYYKQLDQMDCGPTCLRMIAKHFGKSYSIQSLREKTQIGKDGVSLLGISEAAESIGFRTLAAKIDFEKLAKEAPLPCIAHLGQDHFVVVYDIKGYKNTQRSFLSTIFGGRDAPIDLLKANTNSSILSKEILQDNYRPPTSYKNEKKIKGEVFVADPAKGLITYSTDEFCQQWLVKDDGGQKEGIALLLEPTAHFYQIEDEVKHNKLGFSSLLVYVWQQKSLLIQLALGLLIGNVLQLIFPFLTQSVVDIGVNTHNINFIYLVLFAQLMLMIGRLSIDFIRSWILLHLSIRINISILSDFLIKLMRLPLVFFDVKRFGDIIQRIGDHSRIEQFLTNQSLNVLFSLLNLLVLGVLVAYYNSVIFFVFMVASLLYAAWVIVFLRYRRKLNFKTFSLSSKNQGILVQLIQGMQDIKLANAETQMRWEWERTQAKTFKLNMRNLSIDQYQQAGALFINEGKNILITFLAAQSVVRGQMTLGEMLALQQIVGQLNSPIEQLINFVQNMQDAKISLERLNEIHEMEDEEPSNQTRVTELPENKSFYLKNVNFTYMGAGNAPVLENITLSIPAGKTTAIVGMSGSGKTTLLKLLLKFYEAQKGEIRLGETDLKNVSHKFWRSKCGLVMQEGFIFSDTMAKNIAVGNEIIDRKRLNHAAKVANIHEFIESLPLGYNTKIGAEGNGISQGQKQRLLIARAVYKDPEFIFFDEATNALDANNEAVIMKNLEEFFKGRTVVVVAHRLSTVKNADQIVVLDKGEIVELGTHQELTNLRGKYYELVKNQLELGN